MNDLRAGRGSLFIGGAGLVAITAAAFVPAIVVLLGVFAVAGIAGGLLGARSRAGRWGLLAAVAVLPLAAFLVYRFGADGQARQQTGIPAGVARVYFSPRGGCTDAIVREIDGAKKSVLVQAYVLRGGLVAEALVAAHRRGVSVRVVLDAKDTDRSDGARYLCDNGVEPLVDGKEGIAHNKVMVIDGAVVITGSMNVSKGGEERNAENVLVLRDASLAAAYGANFERHAGHSRRYLFGAMPVGVSAAAGAGDED